MRLRSAVFTRPEARPLPGSADVRGGRSGVWWNPLSLSGPMPRGRRVNAPRSSASIASILERLAESLRGCRPGSGGDLALPAPGRARAGARGLAPRAHAFSMRPPGERALALRQFHACRALLRRELGIEPSSDPQGSSTRSCSRLRRAATAPRAQIPGGGRKERRKGRRVRSLLLRTKCGRLEMPARASRGGLLLPWCGRASRRRSRGCRRRPGGPCARRRGCPGDGRSAP